MILRDRITVVRRVVIGRDRYGNDVLQDPEHTYAAEIRPRGSQEPIEGPFTTRYRVFLPASADDVTPADAVRWRGAGAAGRRRAAHLRRPAAPLRGDRPADHLTRLRLLSVQAGGEPPGPGVLPSTGTPRGGTRPRSRPGSGPPAPEADTAEPARAHLPCAGLCSVLRLVGPPQK